MRRESRSGSRCSRRQPGYRYVGHANFPSFGPPCASASARSRPSRSAGTNAASTARGCPCRIDTDRVQAVALLLSYCAVCFPPSAVNPRMVLPVFAQHLDRDTVRVDTDGHAAVNGDEQQQFANFLGSGSVMQSVFFGRKIRKLRRSERPVGKALTMLWPLPILPQRLSRVSAIAGRSSRHCRLSHPHCRRVQSW